MDLEDMVSYCEHCLDTFRHPVYPQSGCLFVDGCKDSHKRITNVQKRENH